MTLYSIIGIWMKVKQIAFALQGVIMLATLTLSRLADNLI